MPQTAPHTDETALPTGPNLPDWKARPFPPTKDMIGNHVIVSPTEVTRDAESLFAQLHQEDASDRFTYLGYAPFPDIDKFTSWLEGVCAQKDPFFHTLIDKQTNDALGLATFMRIDPQNGVMEVGNINYAPALSRTIAGTEAMYLMMKRAFDELGYRRYEWKCDDLNKPSRRAAQRYGFTYEGTFRNHMIYKGRSRDTAWFSITDAEWPAIRSRFEAWLSEENFDTAGRQKTPLALC